MALQLNPSATVAIHGEADCLMFHGHVEESLDRLRSMHDLVVMEGAGSCAEVNLRPRDFVNFRIAHACGAPVIPPEGPAGGFGAPQWP